MSAFSVLVCLFGRQVFILLFHRKQNIPEKTNTRNMPSQSDGSKATGITQMTTSNGSGEAKEPNLKARGKHTEWLFGSKGVVIV